MYKKDLRGQKFNRLRVIQNAGFVKNKLNKIYLWLCLCDCGKETIVRHSNLIYGISKSCGCLNNEKRHLKRTHGKSTSSEYYSWTDMKTRCLNKNRKVYKDYGGRGILICERWLHSFENFLLDMDNKPNRQYTLERINVNGNYEPSNCKWLHKKEQAKNTRRTHYIEYNGMKMNLTDWLRYFKVKKNNIHRQLKKHSIQELFDKFSENLTKSD
jgi:hypothetical protein